MPWWPDTPGDLIVPFTCKSRLCLSCHRKRLFGWSLNLSSILNTNLNHFHGTFTVPRDISRLLFKKDYDTDLTIRYYGIYASGIKEKLELIEKKTWQCAIDKSFSSDPVRCPDCNAGMIRDWYFHFSRNSRLKNW